MRLLPHLYFWLSFPVLPINVSKLLNGWKNPKRGFWHGVFLTIVLKNHKLPGTEARVQKNAAACLLLAGLAHVADVGEEVVVVRLGHGLPELWSVLKHADQDLQAVQVRVF